MWTVIAASEQSVSPCHFACKARPQPQARINVLLLHVCHRLAVWLNSPRQLCVSFITTCHLQCCTLLLSCLVIEQQSVAKGNSFQASTVCSHEILQHLQILPNSHVMLHSSFCFLTVYLALLLLPLSLLLPMMMLLLRCSCCVGPSS